MASLQEIRSSILDQASGHFQSDDNKYRLEFIENLIRSKRSLLLGREAKNGLGLDRNWYTTINCVEVLCGKVSCPGFSAEDSYSYVKLPRIEPNRWAIAILGTPAGDVYTESPIVNFLFGRDSKPEFPGRTYVLQDGMAIFREQLEVKFLRLTAILYDPAESGNYPCIENFEVTEYPVPSNMLHELEVMCLKQLLSTQVPADTTNDAADKTIPEQPQNV